MPSGGVILICAGIAVLWYGGRETVRGVKFVAKKTEHVLVHGARPHKHHEKSKEKSQ